MNWQYRPLVPLTLAWIAGITAGGMWQTGLPAIITVVLATAIPAFLLLYLRLRNIIIPAFLIVFLAAGFMVMVPWRPGRLPRDDVARFAGSTRWHITGTVACPPLKSPARTRLVLKCDFLTHAKNKFPARGKLLVNIMGAGEQALLPGDRISFPGRIKIFHNFNNPGSFDYRRYMVFKKIFARTYCRPEEIILLDHGGRYGFQTRLTAWRNQLQQALDQCLTGYDFQVRAVAGALLLGNRARITPELRQDFNRAGVAHVLAISGLHLGLVAAGALLLFTRLLTWIRPLRNAGWVRRAAAMGAFVPTAAYALLAGMSPSTQRALIMVAVFLAAIVINRRHDLCNTLALAALVITVVHPPALFSVSFQLSFAAVLAIVWLLKHLPGMMPLPKNMLTRLANRLVWLAAVNLAATLATLPIVAHNFNQVSLVGSVTNMVVVPLVGMIVLPAGLAGVFLNGLLPAAGTLLLKLAAACLMPALDFIHYLAGLKYSATTVFTPTWFEIGLYYLAIWALLEVRRLKLAAPLLAVVVLAAAVDSGYWIYQRFFFRDLRLTVVDVGQGSCALAELPCGYTILIDGGGYSDNRVFDIGRNVVAPFLWSKKITTVDQVILSHANSDHLNGLLYILENFSPSAVWSSHQAAHTAGYRRFVKLIQSRRIPWPYLDKLPRHKTINGVDVDILHPRPEDMVPGSDLNANSLVVRLKFGKIAFLLPGDITARAERRILKRLRPENLASTVFVAAHHGSRGSNSLPFLRAVRPRFAVVSAGYQNRFGFPHRQVLDRLEKLGCKVLRTDCCGAVRMTTNGSRLAIHTWNRACSW